MANTQGFCVQALADMMNGLHAFGPSVIRAGTTKDEYKGALYLTSASRGQSDTVYNNTGEVSSSGTNYPAAGNVLTTATAPATSSLTAYWTPSASLVFNTVTLTTPFNALLIYNNTSSTKLALSVHKFGDQTVTAGNFTLTMPVNDASTGLIRFTAALGS